MAIAEVIQGWAATVFQGITGIGVLFGIRQTILAKRDAVSAADKAHDAAVAASIHAREAVSAITSVAENVTKIEVATNSMKDALVASTAKASDLEGEKRGREDEIAKQAETARRSEPS